MTLKSKKNGSNQHFISRCSISLNQNEIVAIPTETVYGLAGMPTVRKQKDFELKKRPFIIHLLFISNHR
jgi:tRNA A37 threonylcarbamoyladenosine synthetase subunit TsaC/SUA5/YrdC